MSRRNKIADLPGELDKLAQGPNFISQVCAEAVDRIRKQDKKILSLLNAAEKQMSNDALLAKCREIAMWHTQDGDECGVLARAVIAEIDVICAPSDEKRPSPSSRQDRGKAD
jgi:hypothetical protein